MSTLYERMGGESIIRPLCDDLYNLHASDPLTADWFSPSSEWNDRSADEVKEHVFNFFSAGIGGPHEYKGRSMGEAHAKMRDMKPISESAFHAICYHVLSMMAKHKAGGNAEREEVLGILNSLKPQVMQGVE